VASSAPPADTPSPSGGDNGPDTAAASAASAASATPTDDGLPDMAAVAGVWSALLAELPIPVRSKWRGGGWAGATADGLRFEVPNEWHKKACDEGRLEVEKVLKGHFGLHVPVEVTVVGGGGSADPSRPGSPSAAGSRSSGSGTGASASAGATAGGAVEDDEIESIDVSELADASDVAIGGVDLLMREFGGELIQEDP
jgi:hypothetical protein